MGGENSNGDGNQAPASDVSSGTPAAGGQDFGAIDDALSEDEAHALLNYDAFGPEAQQDAAPPNEAGGEEEPAAGSEASPEGDADGDEPGSDEGTPPSGEEPTAQPDISAVMARLQALEAARSQPPQQQQPGESGEGEGGAGESQDPTFDFNIPDQLLELMGSEDPAERKQGVAALSKGVAQVAYKEAVTRVMKEFEALPQLINTALRQQEYSRQIFEDFYGTHKDLNRPEFRPVIVQVARAVMAEEAAKRGVDQRAVQFDKTLGNAIAKRTRELLQMKEPKSGGKAPAAGKKPPAALPKGGGNAPRAKVGEGAGTKPNSGGDIMDTLFGPT